MRAIPPRLSMLIAAAAAPLCASTALLDLGYRQMYNLEFDAAHATFHEQARLHPDDALAPASDAAAYLFAEFDRLHILQSEFFLRDDNFRSARHLTPDPNVARLFDGQLRQATALASRRLARAPDDANALLALMLAQGLRSDYEGLIEERYLTSLASTRKSRLTAEHLLALDPDCYDAWIAIGVENYLLSLKPMPVRWFLHLVGNSTDREYGLRKLKLTAERGHYLKPFAQLLLAVSALRARDPVTAERLLRGLTAEYPRNHLYAEELARLQSAPRDSGGPPP
jgi:tetratricopeptide (TPR) repeat protein